ncbi:AAA family ATPase [Leptolyngbya sp. FACHB-261]|uniref:ParA family protein n=1 Tax=Leptolyngbya sp. FACHB-261 TaxID=2692806 RepID=UPI001684A9F5|nr:AAA family ATPase [Leptolyngbya sp. FACHB-261]MBD2105074.1 ParA family protein [Leptolyngbya sp. FACHB-261]
MQTLACISLSGGQGKTTTALLLGRLLAQQSRVLMIDADPQANLTFYLGHEATANSPTLFEVLTRQVAAQDSIYPSRYERLSLIPADDGLNKAQEHLSTSGMGAVVLKRRLEPIAAAFDYCIIDSPPQRSQICMTVVGASNLLLVPAEASTKGVNSLLRSLELIEELRDVNAFMGTVLGVIPFRDKWIGLNQARDSREAIEAMRQIVGDTQVLPSILESERYKQAIRQGQLLSELGAADLETPFRKILTLLT